MAELVTLLKGLRATDKLMLARDTLKGLQPMDDLYWSRRDK